MPDASWIRSGPGLWLVTSRPETQDVVGGVTFGAGWLHQSPEHLGVASLLAAWLMTSLDPPVEAADAAERGEAAQLAFWVGQTESSLLAIGSAEAVGSTLRRVEGVLAGAGAAEVDDDLRDRAMAYGGPLEAWFAHLAARWPRYRPHLAALGPLGLSTLDAAAMAAFVDRCMTPAARVWWANDPSIPGMVDLRDAVDPDQHVELVAPPGLREGPGCVVQRRPGELFSTVLSEGPATKVSLSLLARTLHRRLVEFEPLASEVRLSFYHLGGGVGLVCGEADLLPGKDAGARAAVLQTLEDLADGSVASEEIARMREGLAENERSAALHEPHELLRLVHRWFLGGELPTPDGIAEELERTTDEQVLETLALAQRQLLLSVPPEEAAAEPPFPMVERARFRDVAGQGRGFRSLVTKGRAARCSAERVGLVEAVRQGAGTAQVTRASVDFEEVVLRLDTGDQSTTLIDQQGAAVQLVWGTYHHDEELHRLVDGQTAEVPVVRQRPDPEWPERLAEMLRKRRRRRTWGISAGAAAVVLVASLVTLAWMDSAHTRRTIVEIGSTATTTLPNGTRLSLVGSPELIEHYDSTIAYVYAVQIRMCGGSEDRNDFVHTRNRLEADFYELRVGDTTPPLLTIDTRYKLRERPTPVDFRDLDPGECANSWVLYQLPGPNQDLSSTVLRYHNTWDRVTWRLPSKPVTSPLSQPCPDPDSPEFRLQASDRRFWQGCPR